MALNYSFSYLCIFEDGKFICNFIIKIALVVPKTPSVGVNSTPTLVAF